MHCAVILSVMLFKENCFKRRQRVARLVCIMKMPSGRWEIPWRSTLNNHPKHTDCSVETSGQKSAAKIPLLEVAKLLLLVLPSAGRSVPLLAGGAQRYANWNWKCIQLIVSLRHKDIPGDTSRRMHRADGLSRANWVHAFRNSASLLPSGESASSRMLRLAAIKSCLLSMSSHGISWLAANPNFERILINKRSGSTSLSHHDWSQLSGLSLHDDSATASHLTAQHIDDSQVEDGYRSSVSASHPTGVSPVVSWQLNQSKHARRDQRHPSGRVTRQ